jgi:thiamine pyrophosphokinase
MRAILFANGVLENWPENLTIHADRDLIIAADGGSAHCRRRSITPHVVVGDMDSIGAEDLSRLQSNGVEIIRHPSRKDHTDLELALRLALERGADRLIVLGGLGLRWDMTLANVLVLAAPFLKDSDVRLLDGRYELACLHGGQSRVLDGQPGDVLSLLPLSDNTCGVTLQGLEYPLQNAAIPMGATLGVSNSFTHKQATVSLQTGLLLVTITRKCAA